MGDLGISLPFIVPVQVLLEQAADQAVVFAGVADDILGDGGMLGAEPIQVEEEAVGVLDGLTAQVVGEQPFVFLLHVGLFDIHDGAKQFI